MARNRRTVVTLASLAAIGLAGCNRGTVEPPKPTLYAEDQCGGHPAWAKPGVESGELMVFDRLEITPSKLTWNGVTITRLTLGDYLGQVSKMPVLTTVLPLNREQVAMT
ncbi:hypothetical protein [Sphingomonas oryzagri]